jgi:hypothetical protein
LRRSICSAKSAFAYLGQNALPLKDKCFAFEEQNISPIWDKYFAYLGQKQSIF